MADNLFTVDGVGYKVSVPTGGLKRSFDVLDGPNAGRMLGGGMTRDVIGTFYNYQLEINRDGASLAEYDRLFEVLSAPVDAHTVTFPYGQETLTFRAYVTKGNDSLLRKSRGKSYWGGLSIQFVAMAPQRK